jgi:3-methyladenine DNA glycosylase/8-oxoguanine DNA glycosylase
MRTGDMIVISATTLAISMAPALAGPCSHAIVRAQIRVDAKIATAAALSRFAPQSRAARLHHQPTPATVAEAERQLNEGGGGAAALAALARAREADRDSDFPACRRALAEVREDLGR